MSSSRPVLIVDKQGTVGNALAHVLQHTSLVVLVSSLPLEGGNIIYVPFEKKIPTIPDNTFSQIIIFYHGEREIEQSLPAFIQKAKEAETPLLFVTSLLRNNTLILGQLGRAYPLSRRVVVGDVFSPTVLTPHSPVTTLLAMAKHEGRVLLTNNGLDSLYPIAEEDVVDGLIALGKEVALEGGLYALVPRHPLTQLSFARLLQKRNPLLKIDFVKGRHPSPLYSIPPETVSLVIDPYPLLSRLSKLDLSLIPPKPSLKKVKHPKRIKPHAHASPRKKAIILALSFLFFLIALPFLLTFGMALAGGLSLKQTEAQLEKGELAAAYTSAKSAQSLFAVADETGTTLKTALSVIGLSEELVGFQSMIRTGREVSSAATELLGAGTTLQTLLASSNPPAKDDFVRAMNTLKEGMLSLQAIQAEGNLPESYQKRLETLERPLTLLINLTDASPELLGFNSPKKYLILFQNNAELRPTGGFIGSYGLITLENAKMKEFSIHDVYDADGQLTASIEPPFALKRYLGSTNWFLRDSNFAIDFNNGAAEAASFLKLETGEKVDGVVAVDVTFLSSLLKATGSITLPDYKETLTPDNFYLTTQKYVQNDFFPGSTQKKDFLRSVEHALLTKLQKREFSYQAMISLLTDATREKHLMFSFPDKTLQKLFSLNNLSASLTEQRGSEEHVLLDTVGINEANVAQNKSNYYLKRKLDQKVMIDGEGIVNETLSVTYTNTSTSTSPFGGDYKAYLRLIVPEGAVLTEVAIDGVLKEIIPAVTNEAVYKARTFKPGDGIEIEETEEEGRRLYGLFLEVPVSKAKTISLSYRLAKRADINAAKWEYDLLAIKQPGTLNDSYSLSVTYPLANKLFTSSSPVSDVGSKVVYDTSLITDQHLRLTFVQR